MFVDHPVTISLFLEDCNSLNTYGHSIVMVLLACSPCVTISQFNAFIYSSPQSHEVNLRLINMRQRITSVNLIIHTYNKMIPEYHQQRPPTRIATTRTCWTTLAHTPTLGRWQSTPGRPRSAAPGGTGNETPEQCPTTSRRRSPPPPLPRK